MLDLHIQVIELPPGKYLAQVFLTTALDDALHTTSEGRATRDEAFADARAWVLENFTDSSFGSLGALD